MARVASLGCIVCQKMGMEGIPAEVHHIREGQGMSQRASNWLVVPLCPEDHRGPKGLHGDRTMMRMLKAEELDLLAWTLEEMNA